MDEQAISALIGEIEQSWNMHNIERFAACFAKDADFVNVAGDWLRGRDEIERAHERVHKGPFRNSTLTLNVASVRQIAPDVAVVIVTWRMVGHDFGGPQRTSDPRNGVQSFVIRDRNGRLEAVASHNTDTIQR